MSRRAQLAAAIARRIRGPYRSLGQLDARLDELQARVSQLQETIAGAPAQDETQELNRQARDLAAATNELLRGEMHTMLRALAAEESANRRRLYQLRGDPDYAAAWEERRPLVTVTVATRDRPELLTRRSLPSILAQTYTELEVIVVGDHADASTEEAVRSLGDQRIVYTNLTQRLQFTEDPCREWLVAATMARNEAMRLASGRWVVCFDDDDAMRPDCLERLLAHARERRVEAVYGKTLVHTEDGDEFPLGTFPPQHGRFTWAAAMYHSGLRFFERELFAADLGMPGDWYLAERMLRAGVRFGMLDAILADLYPSPRNRLRRPD